jgi:signal transduction histidine kinase/FixJ family two-component response regulator
MHFIIFFVVALFVPLTVFAAQDSLAQMFSTPFFFPLLSLMLAGSVCWLWVRLQEHKKVDQVTREQLYLARQTLEAAPYEILWVDNELRVIAANRSAFARSGDRRLIGVGLAQLEPKLLDHPLVASLKCQDQPGKINEIQTDHLSLSESATGGALVLLAGSKEPMVVWFRTPPGRVNCAQVEKTVATDNRVNKGVADAQSVSRLKSHFIANINHEVRTPMNAIIGYTEMLANVDLEPREKRFVDIIHKSSLRLVSIFNDIMELSKIESGRLQIMTSSIRLSALFSEIEELFLDQVREKGLLFICQLAPDVPQTFILDGVRLKQVLQNLVSNAVNFTTNGFVKLTVTGEPSHEVSGCFTLRFQVEDSGGGISAKDQRRIINFFRQRNNTMTEQYGDVGLGLTLCSRLVAMMGGNIELVSTEEEGTRFTICLPAVRTAELSSEELQVTTTPVVTKQQQKLLVVDDVDLIKEVFVDFFADSPFRILTANTGEEALRLAIEEQPDLIFMDLNLVGMDGRQVTEALRQHPETRDIAVVVMTGEMLDETEYRPLFDNFLQKPFRLETLKEIVSHHVPISGETQEHAVALDRTAREIDIFLTGIRPVWTDTLEQLRCQAARSGSLSDALLLGTAMQRIGEADKHPLLVEVGDELIQHATDPNILGVDRLLAKLSRVTGHNLT